MKLLVCVFFSFCIVLSWASVSTKKRKLFSFSVSENPALNVYFGKLRIENLGLYSNFNFTRHNSSGYDGQITFLQPIPWTLHGKLNITSENNNSYQLKAIFSTNEPNRTVIQASSALDLISNEDFKIDSNLTFSINENVSGNYLLRFQCSPTSPYYYLHHSLVTNPPGLIQFESSMNKLSKSAEDLSKVLIGIDLRSLMWPQLNFRLSQNFEFGPNHGQESMNASNPDWTINVTGKWYNYPLKHYSKQIYFSSKSGSLPSFKLNTVWEKEDLEDKIQYCDSKESGCN